MGTFALSRQGFWLLAVAVATFVVATALRQPNVAVLSLAVLVWMGFEGALFALRAGSSRRLRIVRTIDGQPAGSRALWAGRPLHVHVEVQLGSRWLLPYLHVEDRLPPSATLQSERSSSQRSPNGQTDGTSAEGYCARGRPLSIEYVCRCRVPGRMRFEGVRVHLADSHGFFHHWSFLRDPVEATVLPPLQQGPDWSSTVKRTNVLPLHGLHRHRRPGTGSELLELRDYLPGDPPKRIAWKISARRDQLITKEYESEVPVRCWLFVDVSESVRLGPPERTPLLQAIDLVAGIAEQAISNKDPVGLCVFDSHTASRLWPGLGRRHLLRIHGWLARFASQPLGPSTCPAELVLGPVHQLTSDLYPELFQPHLNLSLPWFAAGRWLRMLWYLLAAGLFLALAYRWLGQPGPRGADRGPGFRWDQLLLLLGVLVLCGVTVRLTRQLFLGDRAVGRGRSRRQRKQVASVLAARFGLGPGGVATLQHDDPAFSHWAQTFLIEHQVHYPRPLYSPDGRYVFASPEKISVLANEILRSVARSRDNELFLLWADLLELPDRWSELLRALKVALARHHQVLVICPWPAGLPMPAADDWPDEDLAATDPLVRRFHDPDHAIRQLDLLRFRRAYRDLRAQLGRLRIPLILAGASDSARLILDRLERLRTAVRM